MTSIRCWPVLLVRMVEKYFALCKRFVVLEGIWCGFGVLLLTARSLSWQHVPGELLCPVPSSRAERFRGKKPLFTPPTLARKELRMHHDESKQRSNRWTLRQICLHQAPINPSPGACILAGGSILQRPKRLAATLQTSTSDIRVGDGHSPLGLGSQDPSKAGGKILLLMPRRLGCDMGPLSSNKMPVLLVYVAGCTVLSCRSESDSSRCHRVFLRPTFFSQLPVMGLFELRISTLSGQTQAAIPKPSCRQSTRTSDTSSPCRAQA